MSFVMESRERHTVLVERGCRSGKFIGFGHLKAKDKRNKRNPFFAEREISRDCNIVRGPKSGWAQFSSRCQRDPSPRPAPIPAFLLVEDRTPGRGSEPAGPPRPRRRSQRRPHPVRRRGARVSGGGGFRLMKKIHNRL